MSSYEVIMNLIANTTTSEGLTIEVELEARDYPTDIRITNEQMKELNCDIVKQEDSMDVDKTQHPIFQTVKNGDL